MGLWFLNGITRKLTAAFCLTILITMFVTAFIITRVVRSSLIKDLTLGLATQAELVADQLDPAELTAKNSKKLYNHVSRLAQVARARVTLITLEGRVAADSSVLFDDLDKVENHKGRPEIMQALQGVDGKAVRHSHTINKDLLYVAVPWMKSHQPVGVLRLALPLDQVKKNIWLVNQTIVGVSLIIIVIAILVAFSLSKSLGAPIVDISSVIHKLAGGHYDSRVSRLASPEYNQLGLAVNHLAEEIQASINNLDRERSQLSTILGNMVEAVVAVDNAGKILMMNPALARLFQIDERAAQNRLFLEVLRHNQLNQLLTSVLADGTTRVDEVRTFDPTERIFEAHAVRLQSDGKPNGALLVLHDISRLRQLEQLRREFVANVSHELRTPLAAMRGYAETLRLGAIDDKANRLPFLQSIESQAEQMTRLVDDLLDLAAIESGKRGPQKESLHLASLAEEVAKNLKRQADARSVRISVDPSKDLPSVMADPVQIKQVLTNLLDNAIKFNREGGTVNVSFSTQSDFVQITVKDSGLGIPPADVPRVFERFFRVDKARSREMGGTGLGLAIVKHIVEAHGGRVSVESAEGQGSSFSFFLPLNK